METDPRALRQQSDTPEDPAPYSSTGFPHQSHSTSPAGQVILTHTTGRSRSEPLLVWRDDRWVTVRSANKDPDLRNTKKVSDEEFDRLVRNIYKVLLTRGMVGTVIHSADRETRDFLLSLVPARTTAQLT